MRRVTLSSSAENPRTGLHGLSPARVNTIETQRLKLNHHDHTEPAYAVDGMAPQRATSGVENTRPDISEAMALLEETGDRAQANAANLDFDEIEAEFEAFHGLSDETYAQLETAGIPRHLVDNYIEGQLALGAKLTADMHNLVGGEETYKAMLEWASNSLSRDELFAYDDALTRSPDAARLAVQGLHAAYVRANGDRPRFVGGVRANRGGSNFASTEELVTAIRDPRYKKDAAYRADVEHRLSRSNIFKR